MSKVLRINSTNQDLEIIKPYVDLFIETDEIHEDIEDLITLTKVYGKNSKYDYVVIIDFVED